MSAPQQIKKGKQGNKPRTKSKGSGTSAYGRGQPAAKVHSTPKSDGLKTVATAAQRTTKVQKPTPKRTNVKKLPPSSDFLSSLLKGTPSATIRSKTSSSTSRSNKITASGPAAKRSTPVSSKIIPCTAVNTSTTSALSKVPSQQGRGDASPLSTSIPPPTVSKGKAKAASDKFSTTFNRNANHETNAEIHNRRPRTSGLTEQQTPNRLSHDGTSLKVPLGHGSSSTNPVAFERRSPTPPVSIKHDLLARPPLATIKYHADHNSLLSPKKASHGLVPPGADPIISELLKPHPKQVAQTNSSQATQRHGDKQPSRIRRRSVDIYRPGLLEAKRYRDRNQYSKWEVERLVTEANRRHIEYEQEDKTYLVEIMMINDEKYFEADKTYKKLSDSELRGAAKVLHIEFNPTQHRDLFRLRFDIISKLARNAVVDYNIRMRDEKAAARKDRRNGNIQPTTKPPRRADNPRIKKIREDSQRMHPEQGTKTKDAKSKEDQGSQKRHSRISAKIGPLASSSPREKSDRGGRSLERANEHIASRENSQQDKPSGSAKVGEGNKTQGKKRTSSDEDFEIEQLQKKVKTTSRGRMTSRARSPPRPRSFSQDSVEEGKPNKDNTTAKSEKHATQTEKNIVQAKMVHSDTKADVVLPIEEDAPVDAPEQRNKRKSCSSESEKDSQESLCKKRKTDERRSKNDDKSPDKKPLKARKAAVIVTEAERTKGLSYVPLGDGRFQLRQSAQSRRRPQQSSSTSNGIKLSRFIS